MVIDIELTLNRWGFGRIAENKFQLLCFRFSWWNIHGKHSISFEINWRTNESLIDKQRREKEKNKQSIMVLLESGNNPLTNNHVQQMLGISDATATRYLDELEKKGKVRQVGDKGGYVYYETVK